MRSPTGGGIRRSAVISTLTTAVLFTGLVAAGPALAGPDPMSSSSSVVLQLRSSGGLKLKPASLALPINKGALDPTTGAGTVETKKGFTARSKGHKTKVKISKLTFGANGGPGRMDAKIGKKKVKGGFAKLSGGTLTRDGWGAKLDGVTVKLSSKGAKALKRALQSHGKGKASAAAGGIKSGMPLGTTSVNAVPSTVEVLPGGTLVFTANVAVFGLKLFAHCLLGTNPPPEGVDAVQAIPPAVKSGSSGEVFTFPVTGGSVAPDFSDGTVSSAGGQRLVKNFDGVAGGLDCTGPPAFGTHIDQTLFQTQFDIRALAAFADLPTGPLGVAPLGDLDLAAATAVSADANTKQVTITDAPVLLNALAASVLNNTFPNRSPAPSNDFAAGDLIGKVSLNVTTH